MVTNIIKLLSVFSILILSLVIHEIAHARVAYYLGDPTAKNMGRFSFNPLKHMSYMSILLPIALFLLHAPLLSFAKPVPYNESKFKNPERDIIFVSLAGPFANLILAIIAFFFYDKFSFLSDNTLLHFNEFLRAMFLINVTLCAFNLLPIPPLDGSALYMSSIIKRSHQLATKFNDYGLGILIALIIILPIAGGEKYNLVMMYLNWSYSKLIETLVSLGL